MRKIVEQYVPMVEYIAQIVGKNCEVVLHDLSDLDHSIVAMSSTSITGRKIGDPITDVALRVLHNEENMNDPFVVNYKGTIKGSSKFFRSSTYFIRERKKVVGMLCVNVDITPYVDAKNVLQDLIMMDEPDEEGSEKAGIVENFSVSTDSLLKQNLEEVSSLFAVPPEHLRADEKKTFVRELHDRGCFNLKGSVLLTAEWLAVSESSVYRYLKEIQRERK